MPVKNSLRNCLRSLCKALWRFNSHPHNNHAGVNHSQLFRDNKAVTRKAILHPWASQQEITSTHFPAPKICAIIKSGRAFGLLIAPALYLCEQDDACRRASLRSRLCIKSLRVSGLQCSPWSFYPSTGQAIITYNTNAGLLLSKGKQGATASRKPPALSLAPLPHRLHMTGSLACLWDGCFHLQPFIF